MVCIIKFDRGNIFAEKTDSPAEKKKQNLTHINYSNFEVSGDLNGDNKTLDSKHDDNEFWKNILHSVANVERSNISMTSKDL